MANSHKSGKWGKFEFLSSKISIFPEKNAKKWTLWGAEFGTHGLKFFCYFKKLEGH
jgi:hypothetical protein